MSTPAFMTKLGPGDLPRVYLRGDIDLSTVASHGEPVGRYHGYPYLVPPAEDITVLFGEGLPWESGLSLFHLKVQREMRLRVAACPPADDLVVLIQWRVPCTYVGKDAHGQEMALGMPCVWIGRESNLLHTDPAIHHGLGLSPYCPYIEAPFTWDSGKAVSCEGIVYRAEV